MKRKGIAQLILMEFIAAWLGIIVMTFLEVTFVRSFASLWFLCVPFIPLISILMLGIMKDNLLGNPKKTGTGWVFCGVAIVITEIHAGIIWPCLFLDFSDMMPELQLTLIWFLYFIVLALAIIAVFWIVRRGWNKQPFRISIKDIIRLVMFAVIGAIVALIGFILFYRQTIQIMAIVLFTLAITIVMVAFAQYMEKNNSEEER